MYLAFYHSKTWMVALCFRPIPLMERCFLTLQRFRHRLQPIQVSYPLFENIYVFNGSRNWLDKCFRPLIGVLSLNYSFFAIKTWPIMKFPTLYWGNVSKHSFFKFHFWNICVFPAPIREMLLNHKQNSFFKFYSRKFPPL